MILKPMDTNNSEHIEFAYKILMERYNDPAINMEGDDKLPSYSDHINFWNRAEYKHALLIVDEESYERKIGLLLVRGNNELGIFVLAAYQERGFASLAIQKYLEMYQPEYLTATVNVKNVRSNKLFKKMGWRQIAIRYRHDLRPDKLHSEIPEA